MRSPTALSDADVATGRAELLRALGAYCAAATSDSAALARALSLPVLNAEEHTRLFVLGSPPYASIHLGAEGMIGGDAAANVAGFYRALGLAPPPEPDHLAALFGLCAHLEDAEASCRTAPARERLRHARAALVGEHLSSWLGGYLGAVAADPLGAPWAQLCRRALIEERATLGEALVGAPLPSALREAPAPIAPDIVIADLLGALVAPVRIGFVLTGTDLGAIAAGAGAGLRRGERRFQLRSLLEQAPAATFAALAAHAVRAAERHGADTALAGEATAQWWAARAHHSAAVLGALGEQSGPPDA